MTLDIQKKRRNLEIRSKIIQSVRDFFTCHDFLEVETPIRCPAIIPESQIDPVTSENSFLQASPELCMKQMLSQGFDHIFQICKTFRKNERGRLHLPELTLLEWYAVDHTYLDLMDQCQALIRFIAKQMGCDSHIQYQGKTIDIACEWQKMTVKKAFQSLTDTSLETALKTDRFDELLSFQIEPRLGHPVPTFLMDYPSSLGSLAQLKQDNPGYAQRMELYISGIELANGFTELTDPVEQKKRFENENRIRQSQGKQPLPLPDTFLKNLAKMPPTAGIALGVDRLVMLFTDTPSIDHVVAFTPELL